MTTADTLYFGGPIVTIDRQRPEVEALAVRDGRILALGTLAELQAHVGPATKQVDLQGQALLPGFVEAHTHPYGYGRIWGEPLVNIRASHIPTYEAVLATIRRRVAKTFAGDPLVFVGLDALRHEGMREPTRAEMDALAPKNPLAIYTFNFHSLFLNSPMLALLGLDENTPDTPGGRFERDAQGRLTGKVVELAAFVTFERVVQLFGSERGRRELNEGLWKFAHAGITATGDLALHEGALAGYKALWEKGQLPMRMRLFARARLDGPPMQPLDWGGYDVRLIGAKIWADGSPFVGTAWLSRPYLSNEVTLKGLSLQPGHVGHPNFEPAVLHQLIEQSMRQGWQVATHVQGDQAMDAVLDVFEAVLPHHPAPAAPHRIEHCGTVRADQLARAARLGLVCSFFVPHIYHWGDAIRDVLLGPERASNYMPVGTATRLGMRVTYHSDAPMTEPDPLLAIQTAVTRCTASGQVLGEEQRVTIDEALRAMTIDAAYQIGMDQEIGSLEVGKRADFVLLGQDPRKVPARALTDIEVRGTWIDGREVWRTPRPG